VVRRVRNKGVVRRGGGAGRKEGEEEG